MEQVEPANGTPAIPDDEEVYGEGPELQDMRVCLAEVRRELVVAWRDSADLQARLNRIHGASWPKRLKWLFRGVT